MLKTRLTLISLCLLSSSLRAQTTAESLPIIGQYINGLYVGASLDYNKVDYNFTAGLLGTTEYRIDMGSFLSPALYAEYEHEIGESALSYTLGLVYAFSTREAENTVTISGNEQLVVSTLKQSTVSLPVSLRYTFDTRTDYKPYIEGGYQQDLINNSTLDFDVIIPTSVDGVAIRTAAFYGVGIKFRDRLSVRFRGYLKLNNAVEPIAGFKYGHRFNSLLGLSYKLTK